MTGGPARRLSIPALLAAVLVGCAEAPATTAETPAAGEMRTTAAETPPKPAFDTAQIAKGAQLSAIGDCRDCHTADGGRTFAGGRPLPTSFGTIHSTNITPDDETGIGRYTIDDFRRALREGVAHRGACHTPRNVATGATDSIASTASPRGR